VTFTSGTELSGYLLETFRDLLVVKETKVRRAKMVLLSRARKVKRVTKVHKEHLSKDRRAKPVLRLKVRRVKQVPVLRGRKAKKEIRAKKELTAPRELLVIKERKARKGKKER